MPISAHRHSEAEHPGGEHQTLQRAGRGERQGRGDRDERRCGHRSGKVGHDHRDRHDQREDHDDEAGDEPGDALRDDPCAGPDQPGREDGQAQAAEGHIDRARERGHKEIADDERRADDDHDPGESAQLCGVTVALPAGPERLAGWAAPRQGRTPPAGRRLAPRRRPRTLGLETAQKYPEADLAGAVVAVRRPCGRRSDRLQMAFRWASDGLELLERLAAVGAVVDRAAERRAEGVLQRRPARTAERALRVGSIGADGARDRVVQRCASATLRRRKAASRSRSDRGGDSCRASMVRRR